MEICNESLESLKPKEVREPRVPLLEQLRKGRVMAQKELEDIDNAIKALEDNPTFEHMLNTISFEHMLNTISKVTKRYITWTVPTWNIYGQTLKL